MRLTICHFDLRFFIVHNFSNNAVSWHSRHNGGSISQMDRLRLFVHLVYACLYISRKSETPSFVSPVLSPRVLILPTEESTRIVVERLEISGERINVVFRGEGEEGKTNSLRNSVSGNNEQGSILTCRRKGRFAGRTISNCAL